MNSQIIFMPEMLSNDFHTKYYGFQTILLIFFLNVSLMNMFYAVNLFKEAIECLFKRR